MYSVRARNSTSSGSHQRTLAIAPPPGSIDASGPAGRPEYGAAHIARRLGDRRDVSGGGAGGAAISADARGVAGSTSAVRDGLG